MTADTPRPTPTTQAGRNYDELVHETPRILAIEAEARDATGPCVDAGCAFRAIRHYAHDEPISDIYGPLQGPYARDATGPCVEAAEAFAKHVSALNCDHEGALTGTHTGCPERLRLDAALAAAPQEPSWPSRDELAKALVFVAEYGHATAQIGGPHNGQSDWQHCQATGCRKALAALREGAERP